MESSPKQGRFLFTFVALSIGILVVTSRSASAVFQVERETSYSITVSVTGAITERDVKEFEKRTATFAISALTVYLDSNGGDAFAAMKIGKIVRKYEGWTMIHPYAKCYSSCALIFIGGVIRTSFGELGLHRPYLASAPLSREAVERQVPLMLSTIKSYTTEMGITDGFYQQMVNTEPSKMVIYKDDEFQKLIPAHDPVFDEVIIAIGARKYGITTSQMRQRDKDAERCSRLAKERVSIARKR